MIRIVETPRAGALSYRARLHAYYAVEHVARRVRSHSSRLAWWAGERAHALSTGRTVRK